MLEALADDPEGIADVSLGTATLELRARVKVNRVGTADEGPFVQLTRTTVTDHSYPLARHAYVYFAPDGPGGVAKAIDPKLKEFLTYVLSREGQQQTAKEGENLPLTAETAKAQLSKLRWRLMADHFSI